MVCTYELNSETLSIALSTCRRYSTIAALVVISDFQRRMCFLNSIERELMGDTDIAQIDLLNQMMVFKNGSYIKTVGASCNDSDYDVVLLDKEQGEPMCEIADSHDYIGEFLNGFKTKP
jgi:hypothetical protein